jgi:hypothetical protein
MSTPLESHEEFMRNLPPTPLGNQIAQIDATLIFLYGVSPDALAIARHCLREIAIYTSVEDWLRDGIRRDVLGEFTEALKIVTAKDTHPRGPHR